MRLKVRFPHGGVDGQRNDRLGRSWRWPVYFNTGGRYNPSTDSWTAISTTNAPDGRDDHTAVWTDSEMIVWGGANGSGYFNTSRKYNPSTDSWIATSTTNAPSARHLHTAVWTGSEMIVWGCLPSLLNTGGRYNPSTNRRTATSTVDAPDGQKFYTAVWTGSEMIIWGGNGSGGYLNTGEDMILRPTVGQKPALRTPQTADTFKPESGPAAK